MAKADNQFQRMASEAAGRIEGARAAGEQLQLLPAEPDLGALVDTRPGGRGKGKSVSQLRDWLALRGYRMPEDALAEMAGLATSEDAFTVAMMRTEQVMLWAYGHAQHKGDKRLAVFMQIFSAQLRAADALLPYGLGKVQPDAAPPAAVQVNVIGGTVQEPAQARDVTPRAGRIAPPPLPHEMQRNQGVENPGAEVSDDQTRTEGLER